MRTTNQIFHVLFRTKVFALTLLFVAAAFSCDDEDDETPPVAATNNIVQLAQGNANLSSLVAALTKFPDLVTTLSGTGTFTVFAPSNTAFAGLLTAIGQTSLNDIPEPVLKTVLQYHVVTTAALRSTQFTAGNVNTAASENIAVTISPNLRLNGTVSVTTPNVEATNGIVHVIDAVLVPPTILPIVGTIVAPAYFNKNFSTLVSAVVQAGLLPTLLSTTNQLTLFAPTNAAFTAAEITLPPSNTANNAALAEILKYHVIAGSNEITSGSIATGSSSATTLSGPIYLSKGAAGVFINGTSQVTTPDVQASNGIVHVINRALVEPTQTIAAIVTDFTNKTGAEKQFTQLLAALSLPEASGLLTAASSGSSNLTVFAPTDEAFQALYTANGVTNLTGLVNALGATAVVDVLEHHIVGARVFSTDLVSGSVTTLNQNVTINLTNLTVTGASGSANIANLQPTLLNIHGTNGVIHVINKVLLPVL